MALFRYLQPRNGLPDPRGSLSTVVPAQAIAQANREVEEAMQGAAKSKRGPYKQYTPKQRAEIGKYVCHHGATAAARVFSRKLGVRINESTARSIKKAYVSELRQKRQAASDDEDDVEVKALPLKKRGRPFLLGPDLDTKVQLYLKKVREGGGAVSARIAMAAARGIVLSCDRSKLAEFGGHIELNRHWAHTLLKRMKFVQRKATTAKSKQSVANFAELKKSFLAELATTVTMEEVPAELILNWDQTGIKMVPSSSWTMERQGAKRVEMTGVNDKRQITAVFCGSLVGDFLPIQLIYKGKTPRCHPRFAFPPNWHVTHSPKHWSTEETMVQYIDHIIVPYVESTREMLGEEKAAVVIIDNFKGQVTPRVLDLLDSNNIHVCRLPPNTTDRLQPLDVSVNKPAKDYIKREFEGWYSEQVLKQLEGKDTSDLEDVELQPVDLSLAALKEIGAKWLVGMADYISNNPRIIVNGFVHAGITRALDEIEDGESSDENSSEDESDSDDYDEPEDDDVELSH